jgi:hypothetical protein
MPDPTPIVVEGQILGTLQLPEDRKGAASQETASRGKAKMTKRSLPLKGILRNPAKKVTIASTWPIPKNIHNILLDSLLSHVLC